MDVNTALVSASGVSHWSSQVSSRGEVNAGWCPLADDEVPDDVAATLLTSASPGEQKLSYLQLLQIENRFCKETLSSRKFTVPALATSSETETMFSMLRDKKSMLKNVPLQADDNPQL